MTSSTPVKPIKMEPEQIYLQISYSTSQPPSEMNKNGLEARYLGPVGELTGEGIYQVKSIKGIPTKRNDDTWKSNQDEFVNQLKKKEGVTGVNVIGQLKTRHKRDEF
ncbi:uncharacterized protein I206_106021 [Kwoniella pini CBS 10737]|uniref:Uncharacterized protein n=1 Tax=Kwoniella pini CBS 10737 TaxID=1296096 RepID=A0A1B9I0T2_9TREE|nr:uncharacterized protein I206_04844 [Kwoniella pini CBS 10737]OCF49156.1 hypothetical protein I206_04844 [Kwoniella pini CBS 10737]